MADNYHNDGGSSTLLYEKEAGESPGFCILSKHLKDTRLENTKEFQVPEMTERMRDGSERTAREGSVGFDQSGEVRAAK